MIVYEASRLIVILLSKIFCPLSVSGIENIPSHGGIIIASNHLSNLDPFIIGSFWPHRLQYMAKDSLFKNKLLGMFFRSVGAFPIKRDTVDFRALRHALRSLKEGFPILVFPEGTRKAKNSENKVQPGIGFLAVKSQAAVVPVYIRESDKVLPPGSKFPKRHYVTIRIGKAKIYQGEKDYSSIAMNVMDDIVALAESSAGS